MSDIKVKVIAGKKLERSSTIAFGSQQHIITDKEKSTFKVGDADLKRAIGKYFGKEPNDAYLHSPTPWGDLYKRYDWTEVQTFLRPIKTEILKIDTKPTILATETLKNESSKKATFTAGISEQVSNTVSSSWQVSSKLSFSQSIKYEVSILGIGGETTFGFEQQFGTNKTNTHETTVGTTASVSVELEPNEEVIVELSASSGKMKVRITYEAELIGGTATNYDPTYKDHHFWCLPIGGVLGSSNKVKMTEDLEIGFYSDSKVTIRDVKGVAKVTTRAMAGIGK